MFCFGEGRWGVFEKNEWLKEKVCVGLFCVMWDVEVVGDGEGKVGVIGVVYVDVGDFCVVDVWYDFVFNVEVVGFFVGVVEFLFYVVLLEFVVVDFYGVVECVVLIEVEDGDVFLD